MSNGWANDGRRDNYGQHQKAIIPDWELPVLMNLRDRGHSMDSIAEMYDVSKATVNRKIKKALKWKETGVFEQRTQPPQEFGTLR